jgi:hypothetical protein
MFSCHLFTDQGTAYLKDEMRSEQQARKIFPNLCALIIHHIMVAPLLLGLRKVNKKCNTVSAAFVNLAYMVVAYCKGWMNPLGIVVSAVPVSSASLVPAPVFSEVQAGVDTGTA